MILTDRELRFECLKIAHRIDPDGDPRPTAEVLADYVRNGLKTARRHPTTSVVES